MPYVQQSTNVCNIQKLQGASKDYFGDGHVLEAIGEGIVQVKIRLPNGKIWRYNLHNVLFVPTCAYKL